MPNGWLKPFANTPDHAALPVASRPRTTRTTPSSLSTTNTSPLGATRMRRGFASPSAYSSTLNPAGACGQASLGRLTTRGGLSADLVARGGGRSAGVILMRLPGRSLV